MNNMNYTEITLQIFNKDGDVLPSKNNSYKIPSDVMSYEAIIDALVEKISLDKEMLQEARNLCNEYGTLNSSRTGKLFKYEINIDASFYEEIYYDEISGESLVSMTEDRLILRIPSGELAELTRLFNYFNSCAESLTSK